LALMVFAVADAISGTVVGIRLLVPAVVLLISIAAGETLKKTAGMGLSVVFLAIVSLLALSILWNVVDQPEQLWQGIWQEMIRSLSGSGQYSQAELDQMQQSELHRYFSGALLASYFLVSSGGLFWSRYWQGQLENPGGFGNEFRRMKLGRMLASVTLLVMLAGAWVSNGYLLNALVILVMLWVIQGLALIHNWVYTHKKNVGWLVISYISLISGWPGVFIAIIGLLSQFIGWQRNENGPGGSAS